ncbi:serine-rich adhesin for platelets-like [Watersipora subatra]|uniref:serine-rich adhesin for platelets-like n=1 Tax=Watersipora subatra TaxID=2589382 RepID=UPI00355C4F60
MMDIEVPSIDINYDYMLELLITGEYKERLKDAILSISQNDTNAELSPDMSALSIAATSMDEREIFGAMSHLSEHEKCKILDVIKRAQALENQAASQSRRVSIDYIEQQSRASSRRTSFDKSMPAVCPICVDVEIAPDFLCPEGVIPSSLKQNLCSDCKKIVCKDCGSFELDPQTKFQVWVCSVCSRRKRQTLPGSAYLNSTSDGRSHPTSAQSQLNFGFCDDLRDYDFYDRPMRVHQQDNSYDCPIRVYDQHDSYDRSMMAYDQHDSYDRSMMAYDQHDPYDRSMMAYDQHGSYDRSMMAYNQHGSYERSTMPLDKQPTSTSHPPHLSLSAPTTALPPSSPETPRAQRPNFLQISDKDYFGVSSGSSSSVSSSGSLPRQPLSADAGGSDNSLSKHHCIKENMTDSGNASSSRQSSLEDRQHQPLHRLSHLPTNLNTEGRNSQSYQGTELTHDYYLSDEEELSTLEHPPRQFDMRGHNFEGGSAHDKDEMNQTDYRSMNSYPSHELSPPVTDLSPIEDVPSTMELAAEAEWLAYQSNGKRNGTQESQEENKFRTKARITKDSRQEKLPMDIGSMLQQQSLEVLHEQSSGEDYLTNDRLVEQMSEDLYDKDKDSQTSTVESGYESQSKEPAASAGLVALAPLPRSRITKAENRSDPSSVATKMSEGVASVTSSDCYGKEPFASVCVWTRFKMQRILLTMHCHLLSVDLEDDVPIVPEGTTFNIHGGRDMFGKAQQQFCCTLSYGYSRHTGLDGQANDQTTSGTTTPVTAKTAPNVKERLTPSPSPSIPSRPPASPVTTSSSPSTMATTNTKPIPAPRRKADNSLKVKSAPTNNRELGDEIVQIRFDDESDIEVIQPQSRSNCSTDSKCRRAQSDSEGKQTETSSKGRQAAHFRGSGRSISIDSDERTENIKRSMDELRKREEDENEITKNLERQLAEIRRLEERQRSILQMTLRQVVNSASDPKSQSSTTSSIRPPQKSEIPMDSRIDYSSLLSPSFNRKTPLNSPLMPHRPTTSPQSPRKLSSATRRQDMQTISENGGYSLTDIATMSPASSHRTLSSVAPPYSSLSSHSLSPKLSLGGITDSIADQNFRLSTSYTELPPHVGDSDRSGYFSDREADRRKGGEDLKSYTDEARRALLHFEIEKRRKQVEENNSLRSELQHLIQSGSITPADYDRIREIYKDRIYRSRECLGHSNSSLNSLSTARSVRLGYDGFTTDSDYMSSTEHLAGSISQSSTIERIRPCGEGFPLPGSKPSYPTSPTNRLGRASSDALPTAQQSSTTRQSGSSPHHTSFRHSESSPHHTGQRSDGSFSPMPLLEIRTPNPSASAGELVKIGEISRTTSDASFGDPEERIIDAKLEGGKTIVKSKEKEAALKATLEAGMPANAFNFPTKKVLITPDSASKERGLGLVIHGGQAIPHQPGEVGAFVQQILAGSIAEQLLGELKPGDEIVEWNGVCLRNLDDKRIQNIISKWNGEIEITVRLDKEPFKLPRHQRISDEEMTSEEKEGVDLDSRSSDTLNKGHQQSDSCSGFESPKSDKSWSKEFDESRQSTLRSRRGAADNISQTEVEINEQYRVPERGQEMKEDQIDQVLHDMGERLDHMNRQPHSPQWQELKHLTLPEEFGRNSFSRHQPSPAINEELTDTETELSGAPFTNMEHSSRDPSSYKKNLKQSSRDGCIDSTATNNSVTRSNSDVSTRGRHRESRPGTEPTPRRLSHQEKLQPAQPLSPRTGRHPSMPRLENCGELEAMFMYDYIRGMLVVRIERAVGLALPGESKLDPFIKVHFLRSDRVVEKRCTRYIEGTSNPKWEQSFSVHVQEDELKMHKVKMAAWNYFHPKQNTFIGARIVDLSKEQHVDGNLRLYKLDSDPGDIHDSYMGTPQMSRGNKQIHHSKRKHGNSVNSPQHHQRPGQQHKSSHARTHSSSHHIHSIQSSPTRSPQHTNPNSHRDNLSERGSSFRSNSSLSNSNMSRDDDSFRHLSHVSPSHSRQTNSLPHSSTNGIASNGQEVNNNSMKAGHGLRARQQMQQMQQMRH